MSSCFAFGLDAGNPIKALTLAHGTSTMWQGLPVLVVVLAGGFTTNFIWCAILNTRNRSYGEYLRIPPERRTAPKANIRRSRIRLTPPRLRWLSNTQRTRTMRHRSAGTTSSLRWPAPPGTCSSSSTPWAKRRWAATNSPAGRCTWPASSSSARCGESALKEWRGVSRRTKTLVFLTLLTLVGSTMIVGYGNYLADPSMTGLER